MDTLRQINADLVGRVVAFGAGGMNIVLGLWAFFAPQSFFDTIAPFEPYNIHFLHDLGATQFGVGVALVLGGLRYPGLAVGLGAGAAWATLHEASHVIDSDIGGRSSDPYSLGLLAIVIVAAAALVWAQRPQRAGVGSSA